MKRALVAISVVLLISPILEAQQGTPEPPTLEPQVPQRPGPWRSTPPAQEVVPVPIPIAPPKPNGPVQKSLVRITATSRARRCEQPLSHRGARRGPEQIPGDSAIRGERL